MGIERGTADRRPKTIAPDVLKKRIKLQGLLKLNRAVHEVSMYSGVLSLATVCVNPLPLVLIAGGSGLAWHITGRLNTNLNNKIRKMDGLPPVGTPVRQRRRS